MTTIDVSTKICSRCEQEKPVSEFYKAYGYAGGIKSECKKCFTSRVMKEYVYKNIQEKQCKKCNSFFVPKGNNQDFCSTKCRGYTKKEPQKKNCVRCGNEFLPTVHQQRYCSNDCRKTSLKETNIALSKTDGLLKVCFTCGIEKPLSEYNSNYLCKSGVVRTCKECKKKEYRAEVYGDDQTAKCEYCGNDFLKSNGKSHCSPRCRRSSRTVRNGGIPQPNRKPKQNKPVIDGKKECTICGDIHPVSEYYVCPSTGISHTYCNNCRRLKTRIARGIGKKKRKDGIAWTLRNGLKNNPDSHKSLINVGYSIAELRIHLERQFTKGMNWEVFNQGKIHIDHILPQASFDLSNPDEWKSCWALPNLRPMWAKQNAAKRAKIETLL